MSAEIIIASDSHGRSDVLHQLQKAYPEADLFLHCGDLEDSPTKFPGWVFVRGNNDWEPDMPEDRVLKIMNHKIYVCHSHRLPYRDKDKALAVQALENGCDIAIYGHTHVSKIERVNGVLEINPGSLLFPRDGNPPSYARLILHDDGQTEAEIIFEPDWPFQESREDKKKNRGWNWFW
ncbi:metallophosphoesterase [Ileibacterium valens]|uniref:metallophosphoesterase n=1 Tax=Ileibacterium valens TaxID=1862668 RepID=UPI002357EE07|nr:metallophosphoesterase [Ileibacterium valens]